MSHKRLEEIKNSLPFICVLECSHFGDAEQECYRWAIEELELQRVLPIDEASAELEETGAWSELDLLSMSYQNIAMSWLWLTCCDMAEELVDRGVKR